MKDAGNSFPVGPFILGNTGNYELMFGSTDTNNNPVFRLTMYIVDPPLIIKELREELAEAGGVQALIKPFSTRAGQDTYKYDDGDGERTTTRNVIYHTVPIGTTMKLGVGIRVNMRELDVPSGGFDFGHNVQGTYLHPIKTDVGGTTTGILNEIMDGLWKSLGAISHSGFIGTQYDIRANAQLNTAHFIRIS